LRRGWSSPLQRSRPAQGRCNAAEFAQAMSNWWRCLDGEADARCRRTCAGSIRKSSRSKPEHKS